MDAHTPTVIESLAISRVERIRGFYAPRAPTPATVRAAVVDVALSYLGVTEIGKTNHGYLVDQWLKDAGLGGGYYWCEAYAQFPYKVVGEIWKRGDLYPRNTAGTKVSLDWAIKNQLHVPIDAVAPGDRITWQNGPGPEGHTGIIVHRAGDVIAVCEGNADNNDWRNGGAVTLKTYTLSAATFGVQGPKRWLRGVVGVERLLAHAWGVQ